MEQKDYARQALVGVSIILFVYFLNALISYSLRLIMAKNLDVKEYGLFYALFSFLSLIFILRDLGLNQALVKFIPELVVHKQEGKIKASVFFILGIEFLLSILITGALFIAAPFLAEVYFHETLAVQFIRLFSVAFFLFALEYVLASLLQGFQRITSLALYQLLRNALLFVCTAALFWFGFGLYAPVLSYLVVSVLASCILIPFILKRIFAIHAIHMQWNQKENWKIFRYGIVAFLSGIGGVFLQYTDTTMLTYMRGLEETGLYNVAVPTAAIILYFSSAVTTVSFPLFSELYAARLKQKIRSAFDIIYRYVFLVSIPVVALFIVFPELIIGLLFGQKFVGAAKSLQILVIGSFLYVITQINFSFFNAANKQRYPMLLLVVAEVMNIVGNYFAIPRYGMTGAALVSVVCFFIMFITSTVMVRRLTGAQIPVWHMIKCTMVGLVFILIVYGLKKMLVLQPVLEAFIVGTAGLTIYLIIAWAFGLTSIEELKLLSGKIIRRV